MLALYRSGRQADALAAFRTRAGRSWESWGSSPARSCARRHEAILRQDPALDPPRRAARAARPTGPPAPPPVLLLAGGALLALVVVAAVVARRRRRRAGDAASADRKCRATRSSRSTRAPGRCTAVVPDRQHTDDVAAGGGGVWALNADDRTLTRARTRATGAGADRHGAGIAAGVTAGVWALTGSDSSLPPGVVLRRVLRARTYDGRLSPRVAAPARRGEPGASGARQSVATGATPCG